jgi:hypothetical protein
MTRTRYWRPRGSEWWLSFLLALFFGLVVAGVLLTVLLSAGWEAPMK